MKTYKEFSRSIAEQKITRETHRQRFNINLPGSGDPKLSSDEEELKNRSAQNQERIDRTKEKLSSDKMGEEEKGISSRIADKKPVKNQSLSDANKKRIEYNPRRFPR